MTLKIEGTDEFCFTLIAIAKQARMNDKPVVMISSTAYDLPTQREQVMDACLRAGMFPKMMEHLSAVDADAIKISMDMVDEAEVYIGIFAHRYGTIPVGHDISITEMEYNRAVECGIPRLIFLVDEDEPVLLKYVDQGEASIKLNALKEKLKKTRVAGFYKNLDDLRAKVLQSLHDVNKHLAQNQPDQLEQGELLARNLHHISPIPAKPEPYIAHPYTLLQVKGLIGRKEELELLTDWVTKPQFQHTPIFNVVAIGGMGKSALTWTWFNDIAPQEMPLAGRIWWSFYESDASFENFITRSLAYVSGTSMEAIREQKLSLADQQKALLNLLDQQPYLVVLDGLERILIAYARMDAAYLMDDDALDEQTANRVAGAYGLPESAGKSFVGKHRLRKTADIRAGQFLQRLARLRNTRVLISTRLYPADLQTIFGKPAQGCFALFLPGLSDQDALDLWRAYGAKGSREAMLPVFQSFDKHALLLQLLAYEVAGFREAPGDFDAWRKANPDFDPFGLHIAQVQSHVLEYALRGITPAELQTLRVIAGFRMPAGMETVKVLLVCPEDQEASDQQPFATLGELDQALTSLEDRALLGWDRRANRYDLHPIVRGVVWGGLNADARSDIYDSLRSHFEAMPMMENYHQVESVEDLSPAIELYYTLVGLGHLEEACQVFYDRLENATLYRLSASRLRMELLERLFPDGPETLPRLRTAADQRFTLNSFALAHQYSGQPGAAIPLYELADEINDREDDQKGRRVGLCNLSNALRFSGCLYRAAAAASAALMISRRDLQKRFNEAVSLQLLGSALAARGEHAAGEAALRRSVRIWTDENNQQPEGVVHAFLAEQALWQGNTTTAQTLAAWAWEIASVQRNERDFIRAARLQGIAALYLGDLDTAAERLHHALGRARAVQLVEEELPALVALAELSRQQEDLTKARDRLEEVWEAAERGPYPLFQADALNVLARIEIDAGNREAAVAAATEAYQKAWCDGPPYAYDYGLRNAKALLAELDAPEPELPAFDAAAFEPMPEVEIDPEGEFGDLDEQ